jgi:hypothetical protein
LERVEKIEAGEEDVLWMDQLSRMVNAHTAWDNIAAETITRCWKKASILGEEQPNVIEDQGNQSPSNS